MNDEEFLARWSRRKREAKTTVDVQPPAAATEASTPASGTAENPGDIEVDLSSLPSIESITGGTDITAFLRKGIPPELTREALRRAWSADPAIRDFVGLAENAWDFNDPNAMPGFGPLDCSAEQLAALLERVVGGVRSAADVASAMSGQEEAGPEAASDQQPGLESRAREAAADPAPVQENSREHPLSTPAAPQPEAPQDIANDQPSTRRRTHGSALPR
jgi:hypothetical protein